MSSSSSLPTASLSLSSPLLLCLSATALAISLTYNYLQRQTLLSVRERLNQQEEESKQKENKVKEENKYDVSIAQLAPSSSPSHSLPTIPPSPSSSSPPSPTSTSDSSSSPTSTSSSPSSSQPAPLFPLTKHTKCKMILAVRNDLGMGKGKIAAQCGHAAVGVVRDLLDAGQKKLVDTWEYNGAMKIAVKANSEEELDELELKAISAGLPCYLVVDAGHTQIPSDTKTVVAIGPAPAVLVDKICSHLKLM